MTRQFEVTSLLGGAVGSTTAPAGVPLARRTDG